MTLEEDAKNMSVASSKDTGTVVSKELSDSVEPHTVVCALLLVTAVGCDCLSALDVPLGDTDAPSALRISSLVMIAVSASPVIQGKRLKLNRIGQRVLLGSLLLMLAFLGKHHASESTRTGDSVYTMFVLLMTVHIYKSGGIESEIVRPDDVLNSPHRRQTVSGLCFSLMLYSGSRGLRSAFNYADEVINYRIRYAIGGTEFFGQGYAIASTRVSMPLAMGNGMLICTSVIIGLSTKAHITGSSVVAFEVAFAGVAIAVASMWTLLGESENLDNLTVLYGPNACSGTEAMCTEAYRARRFALRNGTSSGLWVSSLACLVFSFSLENRMVHGVRTMAAELWRKNGFVIGMLLNAFALASVLFYYSRGGTLWHTEACAMGCIVAVFLSAFVDTMLGSTMYLVCMTYEEWMLYQTFGSDGVFVHLTHVSLVLSLVTMATHLASTVLKELIVCFGYELNKDSVINSIIALSATVGTSVSFALYLGSAIMLAGVNGSLPEEGVSVRDGSGKRTMVAFALCHFVPIFAWLPLYVCRSDVHSLHPNTRAVAWLLAASLDVLFYIWIIFDMGQHAPSLNAIDFAPSMVVGVPALLSWAAASFL